MKMRSVRIQGRKISAECAMALDKFGRPVEIGSWVRVLKIDARVFDHLPKNEAADVASMVGDTLQVYRISDQYVSIEKSWNRGEGRVESHMLSVLSCDVELIKTTA